MGGLSSVTGGEGGITGGAAGDVTVITESWDSLSGA